MRILQALIIVSLVTVASDVRVARDGYNIFDSANESITLLASDSNEANSSEVESERGTVETAPNSVLRRFR
jgi:hypothetical protein